MMSDEYSEAYRRLHAAYTATVGRTAMDAIEAQAIETALIFDRAMDQATDDFKKLDTDTRGLRRQ